jgi:hypothetical protein
MIVSGWDVLLQHVAAGLWAACTRLGVAPSTPGRSVSSSLIFSMASTVPRLPP